MRVFFLITLLFCSLRISSFASESEDIPLSSFKQLIAKEQIQDRIKEVAAQIKQEYASKPLVIVGVLKGAVFLLTDLMQALDLPVSVEFVKTSSFRGGTKAGQLILEDIGIFNLKGKDVLLIDDIFDSGNTLTQVADKLMEKEPRSLKTLVLLLKRVPRETTYRPDYTLFEIENKFVIGYGLDYKELYRDLPAVYALQENTD